MRACRCVVLADAVLVRPRFRCKRPPMRPRHLINAGCIALALAAQPQPISAQTADDHVDLELVLAVDVSGSMDFNEQRIQRDGYVRAFRDPQVQRAIASGPYGRIAVTYVEWSSAYYQQVVVPWRVIGGAADAAALADEL